MGTLACVELVHEWSISRVRVRLQRTLCDIWHSIRPGSKHLGVLVSKLSDAVEMKSGGVGRSVRVGDRTILDIVEQSHVDSVTLTHPDHGTRDSVIVGEHLSDASISHGLGGHLSCDVEHE